MNEFTKARSKLILDNPFFGTLCLRLKPVEWDQDTGATDGKHLFYNPTWFSKLTQQQQLGFLAHEVLHVVFLHHTRRQERHPKKWNVAADYAINIYLKDSGFILPDGGLVSEDYRAQTSEHIYNQLPEPPQGWDAVDLDMGGTGAVLDHPDMDGSPQKQSAIEAQDKVAINQAAQAAKAAGKLPSSLEVLIEGINKPKIDWRTVLARFLRSNNDSDYSWVRPNRRFIGQGLFLPSMYNPALDEIAIAVDTSGSVSDEELQQFTSETASILRDLNPNKIHFVQFDHEIQAVTEYTRENLPLKVKYRGRGGTAFSPVVDYINEFLPQVEACVYLTDLESNDFADQPNYPVLWITTSAEEAPYGEVVKMAI
jgi:predicted metal-dependent peptidase